MPTYNASNKGGSLSGSASADIINGNKGDDVLYGLGGNDEIYGAGGNDILIGGAGADKLDGGDGSDYASYVDSAAAVSVSLLTGTGSGGDAEGDTLTTIENLLGSAFNDVLVGNASANILNGYLGNDILIGGAGADTLYGGDGYDTADYSASAVGVTVNLNVGINLNLEIYGTGRFGDAEGDTLIGVESVIGSAFADVLNGDGKDNRLVGGAGNDTLTGGNGSDYLVGGAGADVLDGGADSDSVEYSTSNSGVTVNLTTGLGKGGDAEGDTFKSIENVTGSAFADTITGDANANIVVAGAGNDTVDGAEGNDIIYGGDGDDTLTGNYGTDKMWGEAGNDTFLAEWDEGNGDYYNGGDGIDTYKVDGTIFQNYALQIDLAAGTSQYHDTFVSIENLIGASANDVFSGDAGRNQFWGRGGDDSLDGRGGDDDLFGEDGSDTLTGGDGNDLLAGGAGADKLYGGAGVDTADYSASLQGVTVNLATGTGLGGDAQGDTLSDIENLKGSKYGDVLNGSALANTLDGGAGDDSLAGGAGADALNGGAGVDTADYSASQLGVTVNLATGTGLGGDAQGDTLIDVENLKGSQFGDVLIGNSGNNVLDGGAGNDTLVGGLGADVLKGGSGIDTADYSASSDAVIVDLAAGTGLGGDAQDDTLSDIENLKGGNQNDYLYGNAGNNVLEGGGGNDKLVGGVGADVLNGGSGIDVADYSGSLQAVNVDLVTGKGLGGDAEGDTLVDVENLKGSQFNDVLTGNALNNTLEGNDGNDVIFGGAGDDKIYGGAGNDTMVGGAGADVVSGGDGVDLADYSASLEAVSVNLATAAGLGGDAQGDLVVGIENLKGSQFGDTLIGDAGVNTLDGGGGNDSLAGGAGADVLIGGDGLDTADYSASNAGVTVNLATGTGAGGDAQGDTVVTIENVKGSGFGDVLIGNSGSNLLEGGTGNDTLTGGAGADVLNGGAGVDLADYNASLQRVTVNLATGTGLGGDAQGDTLIDVENLKGSQFGDVLIGSAVANVLDGGAGDDSLAGGADADVLNGGSGVDIADYSASQQGVTVNLATGTGLGGDAQGDTLMDIENLKGSQFGDTLVGSAGVNTLDGSAGNDNLVGGAGADVLIGGDGVDTADYSASNAGITVNMATGTGLGGEAQGDTLVDIENIKGSQYADVLIGDSGNNVLDGGAGNDTLVGSLGADVLKGGSGIDTADFRASFAGVTVSLAMGSGEGGDAEGDILIDIENLNGSQFSDVLVGDSGNNMLEGGAGNDILVGGAGADTLLGGDGVDLADYSTSKAGVVINLFSGENHGGDAEGDVLADIESFKGSQFDDVFVGNAAATVLDGGAGNDVLDYSKSTLGVIVNLATNFTDGGFAKGDIISNFENLRGSDLADELTGTDKANALFGGAGNDVITGGAGGDLIDGGDGLDTASYATSAAGVNINLFSGIFSGGDADGDFLTGIENITGSDFNDTIAGNAIGNVLAGGAGTDTLDYSQSNAAVAINLDSNSASGGFAEGDLISGFENLVGSAFGDQLTGNALSNILNGGAGDDMLQGFAGDDILQGGDGNDRLYGGAGADMLVGGNGVDTADYRYATGGVTVSLVTGTGSGNDAQGDTLSGIENLSGSNFDDVLTGDAGNNRLVGNEGSDKLYGGAGNDTFDTGGGYDFVDGGSGVDTVTYDDSWGLVVVNLATGKGSGAEAANDTYVNVENVVGSEFGDTLIGDANVNRLNGMGGNDTLNGGAGNDVLVGGAGSDTLIGGEGDQDAASYQEATAGVIVNLALGGTGGEAAGDTYSGVEYVYGSDFNDQITGDAAINRLTGGAGNDRLDGAAGNDYLLGEAGNDTLIGGLGADVFVFDKNFGHDTIEDFWAGTGRTDRVWITGTDIHNFDDVLSHATNSAGGVVFAVTEFDSITFTGLTLSQLVADDFIFA